MLLPKNTRSENGSFYTVSTKDEYRRRKFASVEARKAHNKSLRELKREIGIKDHYSTKLEANAHCKRLNARLDCEMYEVHECAIMAF